MSLPKPLTWTLLTVSLFVFLLAGCLSGEDDPETPADTGNNGDGQQTGDGIGTEDGDGSDGTGDEATNETGQEGDPQDEPAEEEEQCTISTENLTSWSHDGPAIPAPDQADPAGDPLLLLAQLSNESFDVPDGTAALIVTASAGDHVTLGWEITLIDPSGSTAYSFSGEPGPGVEGVTGEAIQETGSVTSPSPGPWTLQASVTGYVEGLQIQVDADVCK